MRASRVWVELLVAIQHTVVEDVDLQLACDGGDPSYSQRADYAVRATSYAVRATSRKLSRELASRGRDHGAPRARRESPHAVPLNTSRLP